VGFHAEHGGLVSEEIVAWPHVEAEAPPVRYSGAARACHWLLAALALLLLATG
jgi:hypothetical protein